ncbi:MAG: DJ-1/PfpI family protein [Planctomycetota bacterium]|nr:DJ-1/PfpI family protein [Planctomycetota bacterium]MDG2142051.1 DJ-1/PfpI family protein [Planctomycetota bacterium]
MTSQNKILLPLADGFEEIEAITIIDVLRRAELEVTVTGLSASTVAQGAHGVAVGVDANMDDVNLDDYRAIVLPGGLPGATNLRDDSRVIDALKTMAATGRITAAICAAPIALVAAGLLDNASVRATSYPGFRDSLGAAEVVHDQSVVTSGNIITSAGPGTAMDFGLALVARLASPEKAAEVAEGMLTTMPAAG